MPRATKTPSIYTPEYAAVITLLRQLRKEKGITQTEVAQALGYQTSAVSKIERGQIRLDVVQLRTYCQAVGITLGEFVARLEESLTGADR